MSPAGQAKIVGEDPWMVPARTLNPVWSPDSKYVAYSSRLKSLYHAIFVADVETGETKQVTDGLADAVWPAWDASGKYLMVFRINRFRAEIAMARHDLLRARGRLRAYIWRCSTRQMRVRCCRRVMKTRESGVLRRIPAGRGGASASAARRRRGARTGSTGSSRPTDTRPSTH